MQSILEQTGAVDGGMRPFKIDALPEQVSGKTVLDIGGYDGFYASVLLGRGAKRAVVLDTKEYRQYQDRRGDGTVASASWPEPSVFAGVEYAEADFMSWEEPADIVIFYNVLYHCPEPLLALAKVAALTKGRLCLCSSVVLVAPTGWRFYPPEEAARTTVWARPTLACLLGELAIVGFNLIAQPVFYDDHVLLSCQKYQGL